MPPLRDSHRRGIPWDHEEKTISIQPVIDDVMSSAAAKSGSPSHTDQVAAAVDPVQSPEECGECRPWFQLNRPNGAVWHNLAAHGQSHRRSPAVSLFLVLPFFVNH
jgi:hypothetical protein